MNSKKKQKNIINYIFEPYIWLAVIIFKTKKNQKSIYIYIYMYINKTFIYNLRPYTEKVKEFDQIKIIICVRWKEKKTI